MADQGRVHLRLVAVAVESVMAAAVVVVVDVTDHAVGSELAASNCRETVNSHTVLKHCFELTVVCTLTELLCIFICLCNYHS